MGEAMGIYADCAGVNVAPISTTVLSMMGRLTFNAEWRGMAILMKHYEERGEAGSPEEANRLLGAPKTTLVEWCRRYARLSPAQRRQPT